MQAVIVIDEQQMTLAVDWIGQESFIGWLASEKLNGCRAYWDGAKLWTRGGNVIDAPAWFTRNLPAFPIDGEIHAGRGEGFGNDNSGYKIAMTAVVHGGEWFVDGVKFTAFDAPEAAGNWQERLATIPAEIRIESTRIESPRHLAGYMRHLREVGAEGAMFRNPAAVGYETGRSANLLRWKFTR